MKYRPEQVFWCRSCQRHRPESLRVGAGCKAFCKPCDERRQAAERARQRFLKEMRSGN